MIWKFKLHNIWGDTTGDPKGQWCGLLMTSFLLAWTSFNQPSEMPVIRTNVTLMCNEYHDDVIKWKHFPRYWPFVRGIHRSPVNSPHKGQWRRALMFSLICVWIQGWINNREAGDLRRYRAHYDVTVMTPIPNIPATRQTHNHTHSCLQITNNDKNSTCVFTTDLWLYIEIEPTNMTFTGF